MEIIERGVRVLTLDDGKCPFEDWFSGLGDLRTRLRVSARIARIQTGNLGDVRGVGKGVSELRLEFGLGYRIYFAQAGQAVIVLLAGGDKDTHDKNILPHSGFGRRTEMPLKDFNEILARDLQDPESVALYLQYSLEDGGLETLLVALRNVAKAQGGMTHLARATTLGRESLYKTLSEQGNPEFKTLQAVLGALGLRFSITRAEPASATSA